MFFGKGLVKSKLAQGMTEYILIIALVAIVGLAIFKTFGEKIQKAFENQGKKIEDATKY
jgi:Flp pilus assembly pilin Flp